MVECHRGNFLLQCVFEVDKDRGLRLTEISEGVSVDYVKASTGCLFEVSFIFIAAEYGYFVRRIGSSEVAYKKLLLGINTL